MGVDLCISSITYGELVYGINKSSSPEKNRVAITRILLGIKVLNFDQLAAEHFGDIFADLEKKHMRIGDRDMLIAGHAGRSVIPWLPIMCVNSPVWKGFYMKTGNKWVFRSFDGWN